MPNNLILNGQNLRVADIAGFLGDDGSRVAVDPAALARVRKSQAFLEAELKDKVVYGINTGFGPMASHLVSADQMENLQRNLVRSHAAGMGEPVRSEYVLAAMIVRLNTLAKGYSGVSPELIGLLENFINHRIAPVVPEHGAVGTSGDLVQLAHIALALMGEGEVSLKGSRRPAKEVLAELGMEPHAFRIKEGLGMINGTSMMTGIAAALVREAQQLLGLALRNGALAFELAGAYEDGISEKLHALRPHVGQRLVAGQLRDLLRGSGCLRTRKALKGHNRFKDEVKIIPEQVQEVYSLRCIPQVLGPVCEALALARGIVETEMNSVTDNPVVDEEAGDFLHGGNFHGDYIAYAVDQLKMTLVKLTILSERRANFFLNHKLNGLFPPFMNLATPGLTLGLQGLQFVATSTTAQSQTLAFPQYVHSIPTNGDNQDVVSMGTDAALLAMKVAENAYTVLAIEAVTLAQGVDFLGNREKLGPESRRFYDLLRGALPAVREDRTLAPELGRVQVLLRTSPEVGLSLSSV